MLLQIIVVCIFTCAFNAVSQPFKLYIASISRSLGYTTACVASSYASPVLPTRFLVPIMYSLSNMLSSRRRSLHLALCWFWRISLGLQPLPLLRRITLRRPSMYRRNLLLQRRVDQSVSCKSRLLFELRGDYECGEGLATTTCGTSVSESAQSSILHLCAIGRLWEREEWEGTRWGRGKRVREGREDKPLISSISTCVAPTFSFSALINPSCVTPLGCAIM